MKFSKTKIEGVFIIIPEPYTDARGMFSRIYCKKDFPAHDISFNLVQANHSFTLVKGTIRGLHYQREPARESKMIKCISGSVFDVAADMRKDSPTYMQWVSVELSGDNMKMLYIPEGCAHGFQTLEDNTEMLYFHSEYYSPENECKIHYKDERLGINWPLEATKISVKDNEQSDLIEF